MPSGWRGVRREHQQKTGGLIGCRGAPGRCVLQHLVAYRRHAVHVAGCLLRQRRAQRQREGPLRPRRAAVHPLHVPDSKVRRRRGTQAVERGARFRTRAYVPAGQRGAEGCGGQHQRSTQKLPDGGEGIRGASHAHLLPQEGGGDGGEGDSRPRQRPDRVRSQVWDRGARAVRRR